MNHFEANLALLATRQPELASQLRSVTSKCIKISASASGLPTASFEQASSSRALHSRYDPMREARQILKKYDCAGADYFIFLGFGLGYLLNALIEEYPDPSNHYFVMESDLEILKAAFEARSLTSILSLPHLHFAWPASGPELAEQWQGFFDPVHAQKSTFLTHMPSVALNAGFFKAAAEVIQSQIYQIFTDINTLVAKSRIFLDNFVQNLPKAIHAPGIIKFAERFSGVPAVIVSAGPSLDKNIHELRGCEDKILILSTDTALKPLLAAGIDPHFVLTGDPSHANYLHLKGAPSQKALLVAEATSFPEVFKEFEGKTITCIFKDSSLHPLTDLLGNKGMLRAWGSVATMALDFALFLQCDPIVFIGQDLAHTDGRIYCSGIYFEDDWYAGIVDPADWQACLKSLRSARRTVIVEDIFGQPIESTDKLTAYWNWINKVVHDHPAVRFINATEGGILKDNATIASLREALHRYCGINLGLRARVQSAFDQARQNRLLYAGVNLSTLDDELSAIENAVSRGIQLCESNNENLPQQFMQKAEEVKKSIYRNSHLAPILDSLNQMENVTFLRKRDGITRQSLSATLLSDIKSVYADYFASVRETMVKISSTLSQIEANFDENLIQEHVSASRKHRRNHYSHKHRVTIS